MISFKDSEIENGKKVRFISVYNITESKTSSITAFVIRKVNLHIKIKKEGILKPTESIFHAET